MLPLPGNWKSLDISQRMRSGFLISASPLEYLGCLALCPLYPKAETSKKFDWFFEVWLRQEITYLHVANTIYVTIIIIIAKLLNIQSGPKKYIHSLLINIRVQCVYFLGATLYIGFFFVIKPSRCTNSTNLFCYENLHVSESSSVHHQEFIHCTLSNGICHTGL
jgi:hypothetical protein